MDDNLCNEDSYIFFLSAVRNFDASSVLPPESASLHENVHKRVFMTYLRMSTHKESKVNMQACYTGLKKAALLVGGVGSAVQQRCLQRS